MRGTEQRFWKGKCFHLEVIFEQKYGANTIYITWTKADHRLFDLTANIQIIISVQNNQHIRTPRQDVNFVAVIQHIFNADVFTKECDDHVSML